MIDFNLEKNSLQLKTHSSPGIPKKVLINLYTEERKYVYFITIRWMFDETYTYWIKDCEKKEYMQPVSSEADNLWKITKSSSSITISCNGIDVYIVVYQDINKILYPNCAATLSEMIITMISFDIADNATDLYLSLPDQGNS